MAILTFSHRLVGAAALDAGHLRGNRSRPLRDRSGISDRAGFQSGEWNRCDGLWRPPGGRRAHHVDRGAPWLGRLGAARLSDRRPIVAAAADTRVDVPQLLRTIGFAATPGLFRVFGVLPALTIPVFALTAVWMLAAMVVAVRQALDFTSTLRALAVCILGWLLAGLIVVAMGLWLTPSVS